MILASAMPRGHQRLDRGYAALRKFAALPTALALALAFAMASANAASSACAAGAEGACASAAEAAEEVAEEEEYLRVNMLQRSVDARELHASEKLGPKQPKEEWVEHVGRRCMPDAGSKGSLRDLDHPFYGTLENCKRECRNTEGCTAVVTDQKSDLKSSNRSGECKDFDVLLTGQGVPHMCKEGKFLPICGHYFWNNNNGAQIFCRQLGFSRGYIEKTGVSYPVDSVLVQQCRSDRGESLQSCEGHPSTGTVGYSMCKAHEGAGAMRIVCDDSAAPAPPVKGPPAVPEQWCSDFDVALGAQGTPYLFHSGQFRPICGHFFWNNNNGASIFCKQLGFSGGVAESAHGDYPEPPVFIQTCDSVDGPTLESCPYPSGALHHPAGMCEALTGQGKAKITCTGNSKRSEERRVGKECRSRWSPYH
eukprot:TRINITY_DN20291_c0_g2_i1.p1 TRINITY_DN20291_c0_g2~~TRINITY_DN20291_c0_g2_i1.p1  ORF type:complete len:421 (-),score=84.88 TRINITY_DN20291_c0_g2_i1:51-1313(-)